MDNSIREQGSGTQRIGSLLARLQIFDRIHNWLAGFLQLTEEEQKDAGIYLGNQR